MGRELTEMMSDLDNGSAEADRMEIECLFQGPATVFLHDQIVFIPSLGKTYGNPTSLHPIDYTWDPVNRNMFKFAMKEAQFARVSYHDKGLEIHRKLSKDLILMSEI